LRGSELQEDDGLQHQQERQSDGLCQAVMMKGYESDEEKRRKKEDRKR
jgi:hypothetical protein